MSYNLSVNGPQQLQNAVTAAGTIGGLYYLGGLCERVTVAVIGTGVIASGNLVIEEAFYIKDVQPGQFAGTWSVIQTINAVDVTGGAQQIVHIPGSVWALRCRCSVIIAGGGSVSVFAWGN